MKKIWMVLIVLFIIIIPNLKVEALEDSFYEGEYISGEYIKKFKGGSGKYQQMKVFRRTTDNSPVYCIELWETLSSNKMILGYDNNQANYANIDYSTWEKIMLISYYGYGYDNHIDIKWYAITQVMIWKETSPDSTIYFTDSLNGNEINKYQKEINEITELIKNHGIKPSFNTKTFGIHYKENYTVTDNYNVLNQYIIKDSNGLKVEKDNNNLIVKSDYVKNSRLILIKKDTKYKNNPIVYIDLNGQDILVPGSYPPLYSLVNFEVLTTDLIINKMDNDTKTQMSLGDASLMGSKFQLLDIDNKVIQEKEVDEEGKIIFEAVGYGNYFIKEVVAGEGYLLNKNKVFMEVTATNNEINFYNQVIKNKIIFQKYLKNSLTEEILVEKDAVFSIYNKNNEKVTTFSTDENGYYELELPYGKYFVKQERGSKNHYFVDDFEINVIEDGKTQRFDLYNEKFIADIKIINTDFDSNLAILERGASFEIRNLDNNELFILDTNDFGVSKNLTLSSGNYEIKQLGVVDGYDLNTEVFYFEINEEVEFKVGDKQNKYLEIMIPNKKLKSRIEIEKYTEYYLNDQFVKKEQNYDFSLSIYAKDDIYSKDGVKIYSKDEEVGITVLEEGKVVSPLLVFGNYYVNNPIDYNTIEIVLDKLDNQKIELLEKVYEYEEEILEIEDVNNTDIFLDNCDTVIEVPNTLSYQSLFSNINILFIGLGLFLIRKGRNNENN